ncbi:hypothetical protein [Streptomyces sp. NPDC005953]|uniref:hypothetical protein n=1 Tax=Streptomyces sp. NPDC005953 TaxID=3156719 RepID=UPI0033CFAB1C
MRLCKTLTLGHDLNGPAAAPAHTQRQPLRGHRAAGPGTDMTITLLAMFAQTERIYLLKRAASAHAS